MTHREKKEAEKNSDGFRKRHILRRIALFLGVFVILIAGALVRGKVLVTRTYTVKAGISGIVKIVGLADMHGQMLGIDQEKLVSRVQAAEPDIIVYLGDMVERKRMEESLDALSVLTERLVQIAPVYYVDGNHEQDVRDRDPKAYAQLNKMLTDEGAIQLENENVQLSVGAENIIVNLCGISTHYYWGDEENSLLDDLRKREGVRILLCHYPESVLWYDAFNCGNLDVAICGHTHGGLIRVPYLGGFYAPEQGVWPEYELGEYRIYTDTGWHDKGGHEEAEYLGTMIISGGLAGKRNIPRINNPMEVSLVQVED